MYILFSFPPFLFDSDEGMMEIKGNKGIFYKKACTVKTDI